MAHPHGSFAWTDIAVPDVEAGLDFYTRLFDWTGADAAAGDMPYTLLQRDGNNVAGLGLLSEEQQERGVPAMWNSYVSVDDVDAAAGQAGELGADVLMEPFDIPGAGRMAYLLDPTGGAVGLWQAGGHLGADMFGQPGSMSWNELATRDEDAALDFYTQLLGWGVDAQNFDGFTYHTVTVDGNPTGGIYAMSDDVPDEIPAHWLVYFAVADTDTTAAEAEELGGQQTSAPQDTQFGRMAGLADPFGATFRVIELPDSDVG